MTKRDEKSEDANSFWGNDGFSEEKPTPAKTRGIIMLVPLVAFVALAILFAFALGSGDPSRLPSALIGKPAPAMTLQAVPGLRADGAQIPGFSRSDLANGKVNVVNVWASWCAPCRVEHEYLMKLRELRPGAEIYGINHKDKPDAAANFIRRLGNPFDAIGEDRRGRAGVEWGVTGVPETFVVDGDGIVVYKLVGPIDEDNLRDDVLPAIDGADPAARQASAAR